VEVKIMNSREKIEDAMRTLRDNGYYVENLWTIHDVQSVVECTDKEAMEIMHNAITDDNVMTEIWFAIKDYALTNKYRLVAGCSGCGEDVNELDINGFCKKCNI